MKFYPLRRAVVVTLLGSLLFFFGASLHAFEGSGCDLNDKTCGQVIERPSDSKTGDSKIIPERAAASNDIVRPQPIKGADHAAITIIAYMDFTSQASAKAASAVDEVMKLYADDIRLMFKPYPALTHPMAVRASEAAMAAGEQGAFWKMHDLLFSHKGEMTEKVFLDYAQQLKLDTKRFSSALAAHRFRDGILQEIMEAKGFGVTDAPTFFINGRKLVGARLAGDLRVAVEEALGLRNVAKPSPSEPVARTKINMTGSYSRGPEDASVVIVEFSDFQCPFCARAVTTIQELLKRYPEDVRWVFKHFPLDFHPESPLAHAASLAAGEQGKFWAMHDLIFMRQRAMQRDHLLSYAKDMGLDMERFTQDLGKEQYQNVIAQDLQEGQEAGVEGTPTFFINGRRLVGAKPIGDFVAIIEDELKLARAPSLIPQSQLASRP